MGGAILFAVLVVVLSLDVWAGEEPDQSELINGVAISLSLTLGSALVGWFGLGNAPGITSLGSGSPFRRFLRWLFGTLAGAALSAIVIYLLAGGYAGLTYLFNDDNTPTTLITIAAAWAAQASAIIGTTLARALNP